MDVRVCEDCRLRLIKFLGFISIAYQLFGLTDCSGRPKFSASNQIIVGRPLRYGPESPDQNRLLTFYGDGLIKISGKKLDHSLVTPKSSMLISSENSLGVRPHVDRSESDSKQSGRAADHYGQSNISTETEGELLNSVSIGDHSLADILARTTSSATSTTNNAPPRRRRDDDFRPAPADDNKHHDVSSGGPTKSADFSRASSLSAEGKLAEPMVEDIHCNRSSLEAVLVLPQSFVIEPEFNDLAPSAHAPDQCRIRPIKYRLNPTFKVIAGDWSLCGVTVRQVSPEASGSGRKRRRVGLSGPDKHSAGSASSTLLLTLRFPVVKSLRTDEDNYATIVCTPQAGWPNGLERADSERRELGAEEAADGDELEYTSSAGARLKKEGGPDSGDEQTAEESMRQARTVAPLVLAPGPNSAEYQIELIPPEESSATRASVSTSRADLKLSRQEQSGASPHAAATLPSGKGDQLDETPGGNATGARRSQSLVASSMPAHRANESTTTPTLTPAPTKSPALHVECQSDPEARQSDKASQSASVSSSGASRAANPTPTPLPQEVHQHVMTRSNANVSSSRTHRLCAECDDGEGGGGGGGAIVDTPHAKLINTLRQTLIEAGSSGRSEPGEVSPRQARNNATTTTATSNTLERVRQNNIAPSSSRETKTNADSGGRTGDAQLSGHSSWAPSTTRRPIAIVRVDRRLPGADGNLRLCLMALSCSLLVLLLIFAVLVERNLLIGL